MPETIVQQPKPTQATPAAPVSTPAPVEVKKQEESVIKRAASVKPEVAAPINEAPKVTISMDDVKDPAARAILTQKMEEANRAISESFGKVGAEKSKYIAEVETLRKQLEAQTNKRYTTSDVQQLLQRQDFIQAATELQSQVAPQGVAQEAWSSWSPDEKASFQRQQNETANLRAQLDAMQQSTVISKADVELQQEYPDYNPEKVNEFYQKAASNQLTPRAMREAVYWAVNGKELATRAYELGKQDRNSNIQEKIDGSTSIGLSMQTSNGNPFERKTGERSSSVFSRGAHAVLDMIKSQPRK